MYQTEDQLTTLQLVLQVRTLVVHVQLCHTQLEFDTLIVDILVQLYVL